MKKFLSMCLALCIAFSLSTSVLAVEQGQTYEYSAFSIATPSESSDCREITFEEMVIQKMNYAGISYEAAKQELLRKENHILAQMGLTDIGTRSANGSSGLIDYYNYEKSFVYDGNHAFSFAINATIVTVSDYANHRYIDSIEMFSTRRISGSYSYEWIEQDKNYKIANDLKSVRFVASGHFSVTTTSSMDVGGSFPGFSVSTSFGDTTIYLSDTMYAETTWTQR